MKHLQKTDTIIAMVLALCLCTLFLTAYFGEYQGIDTENTALVKSVGADVKGSYTLSCVQNTVTSSEETKQTAFSATDSNFVGALQGLKSACEKEVSSAYVRQYLIGTDTGEKGIDSVLDFFGRSHSVQLSAGVCFARGSARDFLRKTANLDQEADDMLGDLSVAGQKDGYFFPTEFYKVLSFTGRGQCGLVPVVNMSDVDSTSEGSSQSATFEGYAVVSGGKICRYLTLSESRGCNFVNGDIVSATLELPKGYSFEINGVTTKVKFFVEKKELKRVVIFVDFDSHYRCAPRGVSLSGKLGAKLKKEQENLVASEILSALTLSQKTGLDYLGLRERFATCHPYIARKSGDFSSLFSGVEFGVSVKANVLGTYEMESV